MDDAKRTPPIKSGKPRLRSTSESGKLARNRILLLIVSLGVGLLIWQILVIIFKLPAFILPSPIAVAQRFISVIISGMLWRHLFVTLVEVLLGLFVGAFLATLIGYLLAKSPSAEKLLSPYLIASQAIPIVAIAPLIIIWFGPGLISKVLICSLIVFFPVLINTIVGLREVPQDLHSLMRSLRATSAQTLWYLEIPSALPVFLGGLRIGATLSVIGAIVGELVGSDRGLGFLINVGRGQYDTSLVFVAIITLILMASALYGLVAWVESKVLGWQTWRT